MVELVIERLADIRRRTGELEAEFPGELPLACCCIAKRLWEVVKEQRVGRGSFRIGIVQQRARIVLTGECSFLCLAERLVDALELPAQSHGHLPGEVSVLQAPE